MENKTKLYEAFKEVPETAKKQILGGKLKGFTDINPMWRIKRLTEEFGPCGQGWKAPIVERWTENGANGEIIVNVKVELYYKIGEEWQEPVEGIGGSMLVATEKGNLVSNDEAYKMAYTDAISVAFKMLGGGADVYFEKDRSKYDIEGDGTDPKTNNESPRAVTKSKYQTVKDLINGTSITMQDVEDWCQAKCGNTKINQMSDELFKQMITGIKARIEKEKFSDQPPQNE